MDETKLAAELVIRAYLSGAFPMAMNRAGEGGIQWFSPDPRAVMPIEPADQQQARGDAVTEPGFNVRRSLAKRVRNGPFTVTRDRAFDAVVEGCRQPRPDAQAGAEEQSQTWISDRIAAVYGELHQLGFAHSVEAWSQTAVEQDKVAPSPPKANAPGGGRGPEAASDSGGGLVGGLYGVALGGAFFGESMFSREKDASQVCLVHLVDHLRTRGFTLLDIQFNTAHLAQFGAYEIPREQYLQWLDHALEMSTTW